MFLVYLAPLAQILESLSIYFNHSGPLVPGGIHHHQGMRENACNYLILSARQGSLVVQLLIVFGMTLSGKESTTSSTSCGCSTIELSRQ